MEAMRNTVPASGGAPQSSPNLQKVSSAQKLASHTPTAQVATSAWVVPVQMQGWSPQRHDVAGQSPLLRQPGTQVAFTVSQTCPSSHWRSIEQRPLPRQVPVLVSQNRVSSRQSAFVSQPARS